VWKTDLDGMKQSDPDWMNYYHFFNRSPRFRIGRCEISHSRCKIIYSYGKQKHYTENRECILTASNTYFLLKQELSFNIIWSECRISFRNGPTGPSSHSFSISFILQILRRNMGYRVLLVHCISHKTFLRDKRKNLKKLVSF
jgi:hypothetical protein